MMMDQFSTVNDLYSGLESSDLLCQHSYRVDERKEAIKVSTYMRVRSCGGAFMFVCVLIRTHVYVRACAVL